MILAAPHVKEAIRQDAPAAIIADFTDKRDAFAAGTLALTKSGTISLELAKAGVPMVVAHRGSPASAWLIRRMILIKYVSLVNIAADRAIIPELLQEQCNFAMITQALRHLAKPEAMQEQRRQCAQAFEILRGANTEAPGAIAARTVLALLPVQ